MSTSSPSPRSPTTTGEIERFHKTLRLEFLTGRVFATLRAAQAELDEWVSGYNHDRPHQMVQMRPPAERFYRRDSAAGPADRPDLTALAPDRGGDNWVGRRVAANGVISVSWQQVLEAAAAQPADDAA